MEGLTRNRPRRLPLHDPQSGRRDQWRFDAVGNERIPMDRGIQADRLGRPVLGNGTGRPSL